MDLNSIVNSLGVAAPLMVIVLFALPTYISALRQRGLLRGLLVIILMSIFFTGLITASVKSGLPYGQYSFGTALGYRLFGVTPWVMPAVFTTILLLGYWLASKFASRGLRVLLTAVFVTLFELVLNPGVVKLELWKWQTAGPFYGVPTFHFAGVFAVAFLSAWLLNLLWGKGEEARAGIAYSGLGLLLFWTGANAGIGQWVPFGIGVAETIILIIFVIVEKRRLKQEKG
jgi:bisanhydrobacterioruberin hydratase